jgi:hypothetical protein
MRPLLFCRLAPVVALAACFSGSGHSWDEVARVRAPGGGADAVLIETNGGATTSFGYHVYVVPPGAAVPRGTRAASEVARLYGATRNAEAYGATLRWVGADTLAVEYQTARDDTLLHPTVMLAGRAVQIVLRPGVADLDAPPGGMLYNLQGRPGETRRGRAWSLLTRYHGNPARLSAPSHGGPE